MAFRRIEDSELVGKGNVGQPDTPGVSTSEMQRIMDEIPREIIVPAFNKLSDQLSDASSAASLGASVPSGVSASKNVQSVIQGVLNLLNSHKSDTNNPHTTTASQVGAYSKGEADQKVQNAVSAHSDRTDNPHAVTAAQTGAYTKAETEAAINQKVVEIGTGDMAKAEYAKNGKYGVVDTAKQLDYSIGDTITSANGAFDPNTAIGGTWEKVTSGVGFTAATKLQLDPSATSPNGQNCTFSVSNGVCTVTLDTITTPGGSITTIADNLPPPANRIFYSASNGAAAVINPGSSAMQSILSTGFSAESFTLSYAIANESAGYGKTVYVWTKTA